MKFLQTITLVTLTSSLAVASPLCSKTKGSASEWTCKFEANVAGIEAGLGAGGKILAGTGTLSCKGYTGNQETACYNQKVDVGLVGVGAVAGLALITNLTVHSVQFDRISNPEEQVMGTEFRLGTEADITFLFRRASASTSVGVNNGSGLNFNVELSHGRALGLAAGATINAIVLNKHVPQKPCNGEKPMPNGKCPTGSSTNPFELP